MKYLYIDGLINTENTSIICNFLNDNDGEITIGLRTNGGESPLATFLIEILNQNKDRIKLIAINICFSSGMSIFNQFKGKRALVSGTIGMYHYGYIAIDINETLKPDGVGEKAKMKDLKGTRIEREKEAKQIFNKKELKKFYKQQDVYLSFERMKQVFPNAEIIGA